jgi:ACS family tartrate transporter-like MFS transporter
MVTPAAMAVMVAAGMDADGQGFGSAGAQQGQGESCGNQFFHGGFLKRNSNHGKQRGELKPGSVLGELVIGSRLTDAGAKNGAGVMEATRSEADAILRRAAWRLVPLILAMYVAAFLNRVNVGFAALTMNQDLGFTPEIYGNGAGIFFWGYLLFEVPSNLIMEKVGARIWICRIMLTWGLVSMATAFVSGPYSFYAMRFVLGLAEAGLYPGILLYFTYWFPAATRARIIALFCMGIPVANLLGSPLSGWLLGIETAGLHGWQWMYLLEAIPTLLLGFAVLIWMPDNPAKAKWLTASEKTAVLARLAADPKAQVHGLTEMMWDWRVWALMIPDFGIVFGIYALGLWMPTMVKAMGYSNLQTSFVVMVPYVFSLAILWAFGVSSDRSGRRVLHFCLSALLASVGFAIAAIGGNDTIVIFGFCLASGGVFSGLATFWTVPPLFLGGTAAAGAFALINSVGNLSGYFGPAMMGWLRQVTGDYKAGLWACVAVPIIAALSMALLSNSLVSKSPAREP